MSQLRRARPLWILGLLACVIVAVLAVAGGGDGGSVSAGTPGPQVHPNLAPHPLSGKVHEENQKTGTADWQSVELSRGRGQNIVEDDDPQDSPQKSAPRRANTGSSAADYEAAAANCGTDCWTDQVIRGYAGATSINKGQSITLYVSTAQPSYNIDIYRMGWYGGSGATLVQSVPNLPGQNQAVPTPDPNTGMIAAYWQPSYTVQTTTSWV